MDRGVFQWSFDEIESEAVLDIDLSTWPFFSASAERIEIAYDLWRQYPDRVVFVQPLELSSLLPSFFYHAIYNHIQASHSNLTTTKLRTRQCQVFDLVRNKTGKRPVELVSFGPSEKEMVKIRMVDTQAHFKECD